MSSLEENIERQRQLDDILSQPAPEIRQAMLDAALVSETGKTEPNIHFIENLIESGADMNARDAFGNTPVILAFDQGWKQVGRILIERGAQVDPVNSKGYDALYLAIDGDDTGCALKIIEKGAPVNRRYSVEGIVENFTALMVAADRGQTDVVHALLLRHPDAQVRDTRHFTAADYARKKGHDGIARLIDEYTENGYSICTSRKIPRFKKMEPKKPTAKT